MICAGIADADRHRAPERTNRQADVHLIRVGSFEVPVHVTAPPDDPSRLTIVVREGKRQRLGELGGIGAVPAAVPAGAASAAPATSSGEVAVMPSLSAEDATLVRDFLVRRAEMYPDARRALALRLAEHLSRRYGYPSPERGGAERFLESLASG